MFKVLWRNRKKNSIFFRSQLLNISVSLQVESNYLVLFFSHLLFDCLNTTLAMLRTVETM